MMSNNKQKLELTWIGKENQPRLEPRILIEDPEKSYGHTPRPSQEGNKHTPNPLSRGEYKSPLLGGDSGVGNMLIHGDNLLALKALEQDFAGTIKCASIDPPYNTGNAFEHYDDGLEHSIWLSLMKPRIEIIHRLLREDGTLWITIDDTEAHYLKVLCDEVFGRGNFVANIVWQSKDTPGNNAVAIAQTHNHILVFKKGPLFRPNLLARNEKQLSNYVNTDNDPRGHWLAAPLTRVEHRERDYYAIRNPAGKDVFPPRGSSWRRPPEKMKWLADDGRIWWGKKGDAEFPMEKKFLSEAKEGVVNQTWWPYDVGGSTRNASAEMKGLFDGRKSFDTPKPEKLIQRIFEIATNPGDWVLDSFLGSGTTAAVAHKMGRRWIGIELGEHCHTHCLPRLRKVVDGTDQGGISRIVHTPGPSQAGNEPTPNPSQEGTKKNPLLGGDKGVGWQGGGGFKYYYLAPSLLKEDKYGNWIIDERYNANMLAAAMAKNEGFKYCPDENIYWKQGKSTEKDYIFTTTQFVTVQFLDKIHEEMKSDESLLICCKSFQKLAKIVTLILP